MNRRGFMLSSAAALVGVAMPMLPIGAQEPVCFGIDAGALDDLFGIGFMTPREAGAGVVPVTFADLAAAVRDVQAGRITLNQCRARLGLDRVHCSESPAAPVSPNGPALAVPALCDAGTAASSVRA